MGGLVAYGAVGRYASFMVPDASLAKVMVDAVINEAMGGFHGRLMDAERPALPSMADTQGDVSRPNIILVIGESVSAKPLGIYTPGSPTTPHLESWSKRLGPGFLRFDRAVSNATATKVALPSLLSGLLPTRSPHALHRQPLLYHYANALGWQTALMSAQSYAWNNFEGFFIDRRLDRVFTVETSGHPIVNSTGMDDRLMMDETIRALQDWARSGKRFALLLQFNGTHFPGFSYLPCRDASLGDTPTGVYHNALRCMDYELNRMLVTLESTGLLENTVVLVTSDHGDTPDPAHPIHRTESYYQDVLEIPFFLVVPETLQRHWGAAFATLQSNRGVRISLVDAVPTLLDMMGLLDVPALQEWTAQLDGSSLLRPVPPDRPIVAVNTDENFKWSRRGFAVLHGDWKWLHYDWLGSALYNLAVDPDEKQNLLAIAADDPAVRTAAERALTTARSIPTLAAILQSDER